MSQKFFSSSFSLSAMKTSMSLLCCPCLKYVEPNFCFVHGMKSTTLGISHYLNPPGIFVSFSLHSLLQQIQETCTENALDFRHSYSVGHRDSSQLTCSTQSTFAVSHLLILTETLWRYHYPPCWSDPCRTETMVMWEGKGVTKQTITVQDVRGPILHMQIF